MSSENEPLTPAEARAFEARTRRQLWLGLAAIGAVVVLLIIVVMEARLRDSLDDPQASAPLDRAMAAVVAELAPLPGDVREVVLRTEGELDPRYQVTFRDADGERLYAFALGADVAGGIEHGARAGDAVNYRIELEIGPDGGVSGAYRPDRGIAVERYEAIARSVLRQAIIAWHAHESYPQPPARASSSEAIQAGWDRALRE